MVLLAACGGSQQPGFRDPDRLAVAVRRVVEQRLMMEGPRQGSVHTATHVQRIRCRRVAGDRYLCRALFGDGSQLRVPVVVSPHGERFRVR